jgi:hypothetical protein
MQIRAKMLFPPTGLAEIKNPLWNKNVFQILYSYPKWPVFNTILTGMSEKQKDPGMEINPWVTPILKLSDFQFTVINVLRKTEQREQGSIKVEEIASALHSYQ